MLPRKQLKGILVGLICLTSLTLYSQNIEIAGGLNKNNFFDFQEDEGHFMSTYKSEYGYAFIAGIDDIRLDKLNLRFTLGFEKYGGSLKVSDGGLGGGYTTEAEIDKSVISIGFFPFNFKMLDRINLNFGIEFSGLLKESLTGTKSGWRMGRPDYSFDLNERYDRFSAKTYFGLRGRIAYDFNISDKLILSPQYSYYFGVTKEFDEFPKETRSMRHFFGVGVQRK